MPAAVRFFAVLLVSAAVLPGCGGGSRGGSTPVRMPADASENFDAAPIGLRIYPATRFVLEGDRAFLQLGVELLDGLGDPVKGVGILRCRLLNDRPDDTRPGVRGGAADAAPAPRGARLYSWDVRIATREEQEAHWNPVTRCYLLELGLDDFSVASRPCRVRVEFESPDRSVLVAEAVMQTLPER